MASADQREAEKTGLSAGAIGSLTMPDLWGLSRLYGGLAVADVSHGNPRGAADFRETEPISVRDPMWGCLLQLAAARKVRQITSSRL